jgi:hypothetical protein
MHWMTESESKYTHLALYLYRSCSHLFSVQTGSTSSKCLMCLKQWESGSNSNRQGRCQSSLHQKSFEEECRIYLEKCSGSIWDKKTSPWRELHGEGLFWVRRGRGVIFQVLQDRSWGKEEEREGEESRSKSRKGRECCVM